MIIHTIIAFQITKSIDIQRILGSILVLVIMLIAAYYFTIVLLNSSEKVFNNTLVVILYLLLIISFSGVILSYVPFAQYAALNRPIFPFMEPSHYSLIIAPFYLWIIVTSKKVIHKLVLIMLGLCLLVYVSNLTLLSVILLGCFLAFDFKKILIIVPIFLFFTSLLNYDTDYYSKRVDIEDKNLSTLVWLQGWEEAYLDIEKTSGFGIGFQQFGVNEPSGESSTAIFSLMTDYLNRYDGGTFTSKLIGELGIFGCAIIIIILRKIYKSILFLKSISANINVSTHLVFYHCCISYFIIELFIRSMSYIAPGLFIFMVGIIGMNLDSIKNPTVVKVK